MRVKSDDIIGIRIKVVINWKTLSENFLVSDGYTILIATNAELRSQVRCISNWTRVHPPSGITVIDRQERHLISTRMTSISVCYLNVGWIKLRHLYKSLELRRCAADVSQWLSSIKKLPLVGDKAVLGLMEIEKCKEPTTSSAASPFFLSLRTHLTTLLFFENRESCSEDFKAVCQDLSFPILWILSAIPYTLHLF